MGRKRIYALKSQEVIEFGGSDNLATTRDLLSFDLFSSRETEIREYTIGIVDEILKEQLSLGSGLGISPVAHGGSNLRSALALSYRSGGKFQDLKISMTW